MNSKSLVARVIADAVIHKLHDLKLLDLRALGFKQAFNLENALTKVITEVLEKEDM